MKRAWGYIFLELLVSIGLFGLILAATVEGGMRGIHLAAQKRRLLETILPGSLRTWIHSSACSDTVLFDDSTLRRCRGTARFEHPFLIHTPEPHL